MKEIEFFSGLVQSAKKIWRGADVDQSKEVDAAEFFAYLQAATGRPEWAAGPHRDRGLGGPYPVRRDGPAVELALQPAWVALAHRDQLLPPRGSSPAKGRRPRSRSPGKRRRAFSSFASKAFGRLEEEDEEEPEYEQEKRAARLPGVEGFGEVLPAGEKIAMACSSIL